MLKLFLASLLAVGVSASAADARRIPVPAPVQARVIFAIDHRNKVVDTDLPESHFELRADGTWSYVRTVKHAVQTRASGTLTRGQMQRVRTLLAQAPWRVTQDQVACMAFAASNVGYAVNGRAVWTEELCSGQRLDRTSQRRLARVLAIVDPLLPS